MSSDDDDSSVGHCSETKEFDENDDESEPSCTPLCLVPCRQHVADSSTSEDSDTTPLVEPNIETKRRSSVTYKAANTIIANKVASRIKEYLLLLENPTDAGEYHWNGTTLSKSEIKRRIDNLGRIR